MAQDKNERLKEYILETTGVDVLKCMRCGKCTATCPAFEEMEYHPHEFVYMVERGELDRLLASESLYKCLSCFACLERCPRQVEPARLIEGVRLAAERRRGCNHLTPDAVPGLLDEDLPQQAITSALRKYNK